MRQLTRQLVLLCVLILVPQLARAEETGVDAKETTDARKDFDRIDAAIYLGIGVDTFASGPVNEYLNPEVASDVKERFVAGVSFDYRLVGKADGRQLVLFGETVHGVRSTEVDCREGSESAVCDGFDPNNPADDFIYIVRNASSLEAFLGVRWEFAPLRQAGNPVANAYFKAQAGFVTVSGGEGDVVDQHHGALGLIMNEGSFSGSYVEFGFGRNDLFVSDPKNRWKLDGFLAWTPEWDDAHRIPFFRHFLPRMSYFAQMTVDTDFGRGPDCVQSYFGFSFRLDDRGEEEDKVTGEARAARRRKRG